MVIDHIRESGRWDGSFELVILLLPCISIPAKCGELYAMCTRVYVAAVLHRTAKAFYYLAHVSLHMPCVRVGPRRLTG
jgi:hypothetical protein